jgi:hypothetical protein
MRLYISKCLLLGALGCLLSADTIKTKDRETNASVAKFVNDELTIVARFEDRSKPTDDSGIAKTFTIKRRDIEVIEFNLTTYNPGPPPKAIGIGPPLITKETPTSSTEPPDTIVLRGNQRRACKLVEIDDQSVHCAGKDGDYPRRIVLRILLGVPQR